jgi:hypothetical protein
MEQPQESELLALSGMLSIPILKELFKSIFAEQQVAAMQDCNEFTLSDERHKATCAASRADAFGDVTKILDEFVELYGHKEGPEEEDKEE